MRMIRSVYSRQLTDSAQHVCTEVVTHPYTSYDLYLTMFDPLMENGGKRGRAVRYVRILGVGVGFRPGFRT